MAEYLKSIEGKVELKYMEITTNVGHGDGVALSPIAANEYARHKIIRVTERPIRIVGFNLGSCTLSLKEVLTQVVSAGGDISPCAGFSDASADSVVVVRYRNDTGLSINAESPSIIIDKAGEYVFDYDGACFDVVIKQYEQFCCGG